MKLYDNAFSPFARKVRLVLDHKGLSYEAVDGLSPAGHAALAAVNPRVEVPALQDGDLVVVNSSDIVAYLDHRYPTPAVWPADPALRVQARAWERRADAELDAILHDMSYGGIGFPEAPPAGLVEAGREALEAMYADLEQALDGKEFICGELSIADLALFPHMTAVRFLGVPIESARFPRLLTWYKRMRALDICRADLARAQSFLEKVMPSIPRPERIVWRGDRIEWLLARGYHEWFAGEIRAGRVAWPKR
jgi:glutathione S-transferase